MRLDGYGARGQAHSLFWVGVCSLLIANADQVFAQTNLRLYQSCDADLTATQACGNPAPVVGQNITVVPGRVDRCLRIGQGAKLAYQTKEHINPGSGSILLWVRPTGDTFRSGASRSIVDCATGDGSNNDICLSYFPQIPGLGATFDAISVAEFHDRLMPWAANQWYHVALTWDCRRGVDVYCNDVEVLNKRITWKPLRVSPRFSLGCGYRLDNPIHCDIDELFIYDRALSKEEVHRHRTWTGGKLPEIASVKPYEGPIAEGAVKSDEYMSRQQIEPLAPRPEIYDVEHSIIHYDKKTYCGHPLQAVFKYYGKGEIVVGHNHAPCDYRVESDVRHGPSGYHGRAVVLLQRSTDYGKTWPEEEEIVIYRECDPPEKKREFLFQPNAPRDRIDMFSPDSLFFFTRTWLPELKGKLVCACMRSADRGRIWEKVPTIIPNPLITNGDVLKSCHPILRMPDGRTLLAAMSMNMPGAPKHSGPAIFRSTDNGVSWRYEGVGRGKPRGRPGGRFTYPGLLRMPGGELHCYFVHVGRGYVVDGVRNAICMTESRDEGKTWSDPVPITGKGRGCWKNPGPVNVPPGASNYRAPWPMLLDDGRILVLFNRRRMPIGIGGVISGDGGKTWSHEFAVRDDGVGTDSGYPVAGQFEDGRIFVAYYYTMPDGNKFGGTRYMAGSQFRIR